MADILNQRAIERKVYEEVVNIIVDYVSNEFSSDEQARLRIYALIADNFKGMVKVLKPPPSHKPLLIEYGETDALE
jgi:hypothetical protein